MIKLVALINKIIYFRGQISLKYSMTKNKIKIYQMKKINALNITMLLFLLLPTFLLAQKKQYFDGPYIFQLKDSLQIKWVEAGVPHDTLILKKDAGIFKRNNLPVVDLQDLDFQIEEKSTFEKVEKIVALSDVHGQYDVLIKLLQAQNIIDEERHWKYDKGHLVIVGDNFDRGDKVTEILWFLFHLQKEAQRAGGKVHVLLGNHEVMVLKGDLRYLNKKYLYTSGVFTTQYHHFFKKGSVLGDWIAGHNVVISIDQRMFLHGGISPAILNLSLSLQDINTIFRTEIIRGEKAKIKKNEKLLLLFKSEGPLWFRGYFGVNKLDIEGIDAILNRFKQQTIVVGHTSMEQVTPYYDNKVIAVDCSIKRGEKGQVLIIENGEFSIGDYDGSKLSFPKKKSLFEYIYQLEGRPQLTLNTKTSQLIRKKSKEEYQPVHFKLADESGKELLSHTARMRARGNMRKKVCSIPPVKIDFGSKLLDSLGFVIKIDKLKFVFPCNSSKKSQDLLFKEYLLYKLYDLLDDNGMRVKLVDMKINDREKEKFKWTCFVIEDEEEYVRRQEARLLEKGKLSASRLEREPFLKMIFFQYMIANTDWSIKNKHNIELVKLPKLEKIVAVPYDFDYAGFVGTDYSVPADVLPIENVHERYFFSSNKISEEEFDRMVKYFLSIEQDIYKICDQATYMNAKTIEANKKYLKDFFELLRKPEKLKKDFVK